MKVLVLNGGSSSLKCWYHDLAADPQTTQAPQPLWQLHLDLRSDEHLEVASTKTSSKRLLVTIENYK